MDIETIGTDFTAESSVLVGIGFANDSGSVIYVGLRGADSTAIDYLKRFLRAGVLVAHNVMFDGAWLANWTGTWLNWKACTYAMYKQLATEGYPSQRWDLKRAQVELLGWDEANDKPLKAYLAEHGIPLSRMGEAPDDILGPYCGLDSYSCLSLYHLLQSSIQYLGKDIERAFMASHGRFLSLVSLLAKQQKRGLAVDEHKLDQYLQAMTGQIADRMQQFKEHNTVAPIIVAWEAEKYEAYKAQTPKGRLAPDSKHFKFNVNSKPQLEYLFYDKLGMKPHKVSQATGRRSVDKKILPHLGEPGKILASYNTLVKEQGYVNSCLQICRGGVLHPQFRAPGTLTGRLSGSGGFNLQQQPKTRGYLECFTARPGHKLVQLDFSSIEPTVLAEFSHDKALMDIYGPTASPHQNIYLFTAAHIQGLGDNILKYYDPKNPTKEGVALAKKNCKADYDVAKTVQLAKTYNAGAGKIHETLTLAGIKISFAQVKRICEQFDRLYGGVADFKTKLEGEWASNNGWILNGIGRPLTVADNLTKDLVNRFCQSTGHDLLVWYVSIIDRLRNDRAVEMYPLIVDYHDETIWEAPDSQVEAASAILRDALSILNSLLRPTIPIKGEVAIAETLADIKLGKAG